MVWVTQRTEAIYGGGWLLYLCWWRVGQYRLACFPWHEATVGDGVRRTGRRCFFSGCVGSKGSRGLGLYHSPGVQRWYCQNFPFFSSSFPYVSYFYRFLFLYILLHLLAIVLHFTVQVGYKFSLIKESIVNLLSTYLLVFYNYRVARYCHHLHRLTRM